MTLVRLNQDMFPSFNGLFDNFFSTELNDWRRNNFSQDNSTLPQVNIKETKDSFEVEMAAPGMDKDNFDIQLDHQLLTIISQKESREQVENENYTKREFNYSSFQRSFHLPDSANADEISASYREGILCISIPKKEEAKPRAAKSIAIA